MIPQRLVEAYLRFLLKYKGSVAIAIAAMTAGFCWYLMGMRLHTDFRDFYPKFRTGADAFAECREKGEANFFACFVRAAVNPGPDPYMQIYTDFRRMFGSANIMSVILEVQNGDIYNPTTLQKLDRITRHIIDSKGVNPQQVLSIAHPRVKSITSRTGAIQIRPLYYPELPRTPEDAERVKFSVYATKGVRGILTSLDDTAAVVHAGYWEEELDFNDMYARVTALVEAEQDANHKIYVTGFPWLYTSVLRYAPQVLIVFICTFVAIAFLLYAYFRTWTGIWVPIFSAVLSTIWGLGIAVMLGFNLDPLVLVIPVFLTARATSHSVQSMDRYHEEFYRLKDKQQAIVVSYSALFAPAIAAIVTDGLGLLVIAVAPIPLIQKVAIFSSFWVVSIFISVVTLHPIILSYIDPPPEHEANKAAPVVPVAVQFLAVSAATALVLFGYFNGWFAFMSVPAMQSFSDGMFVLLILMPLVGWLWWHFSERAYVVITKLTIKATEGPGRWIVTALTVAAFVIGWSWGHTLKVGDMTPGAALLFPDHPYNVSFNKLNDKFLGASQLIVITDTKQPDGIKNRDALMAMEEFADYMVGAPGASTSVTIIDIVKVLARLYHDGDPKWGIIPDKPKEIGQLFYVFTSSAQAGDLDRFMDSSGRYGTVLTLFRGYSHDVVMKSIEYAKAFVKDRGNDTGAVEFKFAGGLFGVLAAVNNAVENSYWTNLVLIFLIIYICLYLTYGSWTASTLLMIPVVLSQVVAEAMMVVLHVDLNVNSLPIAAAGAGAGVDYGIYHFSRMIDAYDEIGDLDEAIDYATATTGKAIIFVASTMVASTIFWWFASLKFQAEMGILLALLMIFNTIGGLVGVPALIKIVRPGFLVNRVPHRVAAQLEEQEREKAVAGS